MNGIPTVLDAREYRSRLEARWAAFFGLLGWNFEYEPFDCNGWIPDFMLLGKRFWSSEEGRDMPANLPTTQILVEIKPYVNLKDFDTKKIMGSMRGTPYWGKEILLLGSTIFEEYENSIGPALGWLGDFFPEEETEEGKGGYDFEWATFVLHDSLGFCHSLNSYHDRISGEYCGGHIPTPRWEDVRRLWNQAGNIVKWYPRG